MNKIRSVASKMSLVFAVMILLQSCAVYNRNNTPIKNVVIDQTKVKVKNKEVEVIKFKRIKFEDNTYVGITRSGYRQVIDIDNIESIRSYDVTATVFSNALAVIAVTTTVLLTVVS